MKCKVTNKTIKPFMSFGKMPLANGFLKKEDFNKEFFFNLEVGFSEELSLFQLNEFPNPKKMFNENYPFFSGSSEYMKKHFFNYFNWIKKNYLNNKSKVIEIEKCFVQFLADENFDDEEKAKVSLSSLTKPLLYKLDNLDGC